MLFSHDGFGRAGANNEYQGEKGCVEPTEILEDVLLKEDDPEKFTRIGTSMKEKAKKDLVQFLRKRIDVFVWSHDNMPRIDPSVNTHRLNLYLSSKPVR